MELQNVLKRNLSKELKDEVVRIKKALEVDLSYEYNQLERLFRTAYYYWNTNQRKPKDIPTVIVEVASDDYEGRVMDNPQLTKWLVNHMDDRNYGRYNEIFDQIESRKSIHLKEFKCMDRWGNIINTTESAQLYISQLEKELQQLHDMQIDIIKCKSVDEVSEQFNVMEDSEAIFQSWVRELKKQEREKEVPVLVDRSEVKFHEVSIKGKAEWWKDEKAWPSNKRQLISTNVKDVNLRHPGTHIPVYVRNWNKKRLDWKDYMVLLKAIN